MESDPRVFIVVLTTNQYENSRLCLASIEKLNYKNLRTILLMNLCSDEMMDRLKKEFPDVHYVPFRENLWFSKSNNEGINITLGDDLCKYIFILNDDTELEPDIVDVLVKFAEEEAHKKAGSFQPEMIWYYDKNLLDTGGVSFSGNGLSFGNWELDPVSLHREPVEILGPCAAGAFYRREAVEELIKKDGEFFDSDFLINAEEHDVAFRLQWRGWKSYFVPGAVVFHKRGRTFKNIKSQVSYLSHRNGLYLLAKDLPVSFLLLNSPLIVFTQVATIVFNFVKHGPQRGFSVVTAKWEGLKNWSKMRAKSKKIEKGDEDWKRIKTFFLLRWRIKRRKV